MAEYTSIADRFDGGGPGQSGDKFEGGGVISAVGNNSLAGGIVRTVAQSAGGDRDSGGGSSSSGNRRPATISEAYNAGSRRSRDNSASRDAPGVATPATSVVAAPEGPTFEETAEEAYKDTNIGSVFDDPERFLTGKAAEAVPEVGVGKGTTVDPGRYPNPGTEAREAAQGNVETVNTVPERDAQGYTADKVADDVANFGQSTAAQGTVSDGATMDAEQISVDDTAAGRNALGQALNKAAQQGMTVLNTSTVSGKLLAQELGEGTYTDAKATVQGQMEILSKQFVDGNGDPKIPSWAAGVARNVSKIAAFKGMTGTAATAAMSQAIMEASLPMAQQDAQFFQTVTLENLSNRQQQTMQKAQVLSNLELANLDARTQAAVVNAQAFLQMDLTNLQNEQQSEIVNTQARVQALLEDSRAENATRLFSAQSQNDFTKFYDQLNTQIEQFSATQKNAMEQFNVSESNGMSMFNDEMELNRETFYKEMQFNIDMANAKWRQNLQTQETEMAFTAAMTDVQNMFAISSEAMTRMWDREDSVLAYTWEASQNEEDRDLEMYIADRTAALKERQIGSDEDAAFGAGLFEVGKWLFPTGLGGIFG